MCSLKESDQDVDAAVVGSHEDDHRRIVLWSQNRERRGWEEEVSVVFKDVTFSSRIAKRRLVSLGAMRLVSNGYLTWQQSTTKRPEYIK